MSDRLKIALAICVAILLYLANSVLSINTKRDLQEKQSNLIKEILVCDTVQPMKSLVEIDKNLNTWNDINYKSRYSKNEVLDYYRTVLKFHNWQELTTTVDVKKSLDNIKSEITKNKNATLKNSMFSAPEIVNIDNVSDSYLFTKDGYSFYLSFLKTPNDEKELSYHVFVVNRD